MMEGEGLLLWERSGWWERQWVRVRGMGYCGCREMAQEESGLPVPSSFMQNIRI